MKPEDRKVLRSVYFEPELDARLASQATRDGVFKSALIRQYCLEGLQRAWWRDFLLVWGSIGEFQAQIEVYAHKCPGAQCSVSCTNERLS